ncbi:MAG TPA: hypothetical protein HPP51_00860 [Planctomycetes bacterium]|nr:hypothetical protein [Planctomycetota bacterium]
METIKETKKALRLEKDGVRFWIQKRWIKDDGQLTPAGQKAFKEAKDQQAYNESLQALPGPVAWESDKAIGVDGFFLMARCDGEVDRVVRQRLFFPKSQITDSQVKGWLLTAKINEATDKAVIENEHFSVIDFSFENDF